MCGAFGTLCVLTELTFRVYPKPPLAVTLCVADVDAGGRLRATCARSRTARWSRRAWPICRRMLMPGDRARRGADPAGRRAPPLEEKIALAHGLLGGAVQRIEGDPFAAIAQWREVRRSAWRCLAGDDRAVRCAARGAGTECAALAGRLGRRPDLAGGRARRRRAHPRHRGRGKRPGHAAARPARTAAPPRPLCAAAAGAGELPRGAKRRFRSAGLFNPGRI